MKRGSMCLCILVWDREATAVEVRLLVQLSEHLDGSCRIQPAAFGVPGPDPAGLFLGSVLYVFSQP